MIIALQRKDLQQESAEKSIESLDLEDFYTVAPEGKLNFALVAMATTIFCVIGNYVKVFKDQGEMIYEEGRIVEVGNMDVARLFVNRHHSDGF